MPVLLKAVTSCDKCHVAAEMTVDVSALRGFVLPVENPYVGSNWWISRDGSALCPSCVRVRDLQLEKPASAKRGHTCSGNCLCSIEGVWPHHESCECRAGEAG